MVNRPREGLVEAAGNAESRPEASAARLRRAERGGRGGGRAAARATPDRKDHQDSELSDTIFGLYSQGRRLNRLIAARHGLTAPQLAAMSLLVHVGSLSLGELGDRMHTGASTLTGIVDRMEREGLVSRERSAEDRRVWRVALTTRGRALATHLEAMPGGIVREALSALTATERRELGRLLGKLSGAVIAAGKKAGLLTGEENGDE